MLDIFDACRDSEIRTAIAKIDWFQNIVLHPFCLPLSSGGEEGRGGEGRDNLISIVSSFSLRTILGYLLPDVE